MGEPAWWQRGAIYQIYPRSFADADGNGVGDLRGVIEHLDHLNDRILAGCTAVIEKYGLSGYAIGVGSKGCVTFSPRKIDSGSTPTDSATTSTRRTTPTAPSRSSTACR